jgi:hypothetical protein
MVNATCEEDNTLKKCAAAKAEVANKNRGVPY